MTIHASESFPARPESSYGSGLASFPARPESSYMYASGLASSQPGLSLAMPVV